MGKEISLRDSGFARLYDLIPASAGSLVSGERSLRDDQEKDTAQRSLTEGRSEDRWRPGQRALAVLSGWRALSPPSG